MSRNEQYNTYYDPVGSQSTQPSGYRYQTAAPSASAAAYPGSSAPAGYGTAPEYPSYGSGSYTNQQYASAPHASSEQGGSSSTNRAAAALSSLSGQAGFNQASSAAQSTANQYDNAGWGNATYPSSSYASTNLQMPNRTHANNSPLYPSATSTPPMATFGRLRQAPPLDQTQSNAQTYNSQATTQTFTSSTPVPTDRSYQTAYTQPAQSQTQPQHYASPLHAVQAQQQQQQQQQPAGHGHAQQASRDSTHQPSPHLSAQQGGQQVSNIRQQSTSVEPTGMTVNPSQVYDFRAEQEKKARIEAERRRKVEEAEVARKAEEDRIAGEKRTVEEAERKTREAAADKEAEKVRKTEERRKAKEEKKQSKTAATALTKMAWSGGDEYDAPPANEEEAEMRTMFKKMREFNAKNPAMLAKLWEEERRSHGSESPVKAASPTQTKTSPPKEASVGSSTPNGLSVTPQQPLKPFKRPEQPPAPAQQPGATTKSTIQSQLWPPGKKGFLAEAAAKWLSSQTPGKAISKQQVLERLDSNPTYVQLCESLETFGLKFERAAFARELLRAVPEGGKQPTAPNQGTPLANVNGTAPQVNGSPRPPSGDMPKKRGRPTKEEQARRAALDPMRNGGSVNNSTVNYETPAFQSLAEAAAEINSMHRPPAPVGMGGPVQSPYQMPPVPTQSQTLVGHSRSPSPSPSQPSEQKAKVESLQPPKPPANKEEAARKRTFSDLVDLTKEDDSDGEMPQRKLIHTEGWQKAPSLGPGMPNLVQYQGSQYGVLRPPPTAPMTVPTSVQSSSDPLGKPSSVTPTPVQAQDPPPKPKAKRPNYERLQEERLRGKMLVEPIMRDRVARKSSYDSRTIARDVLLATGRHPDMRPLNAHMNEMQRMLASHGGLFDGGGNRSDLATIRWDIIDPEPAAKMKSTATRDSTIDAGDADDEDDASGMGVMRQQAVPNGDGTVSFVSVREQITGKPSASVKRNRKIKYNVPGTFNFTNGSGERRTYEFPSRDVSGPSDARRASGPGGARQTPTQPSRGTPASAPAARTAAPGDASTGVPVGYSQFKRYDENGNEIKRKGRPVGWRKNIHSREAQGLTPAKPGSSSVPSRLRQTHTPKMELQEPHYQVYECKWKDCKAQLHNLEVLKKHVVKLHGKPNEDRVYECLWKGCREKTRSSETRFTFDELEPWLKHVDEQHLRSIAWELGDGPKGGISDRYDTDSEAYLSDAHGRSVTPIITPRQAQTGEATSQVMPAMQESQPIAELQKLEDQMRSTGPSLARTGSRLANNKRRMGFLDDENFEDVIESDDIEESVD